MMLVLLRRRSFGASPRAALRAFSASTTSVSTTPAPAAPVAPVSLYDSRTGEVRPLPISHGRPVTWYDAPREKGEDGGAGGEKRQREGYREGGETRQGG